MNISDLDILDHSDVIWTGITHGSISILGLLSLILCLFGFPFIFELWAKLDLPWVRAKEHKVFKELQAELMRKRLAKRIHNHYCRRNYPVKLNRHRWV